MVVAALVGHSNLPPYDDALIMRRLAENFVQHGVWAWNVQDGPVHASTTQLWQLVLTVIAAVTDHTLWAARLVSAAALVAAGALLARVRPAAAVLVGLASPLALPTVLSGMETALTLALGAALVTVPRGASVFTVLLYAARPDTLLLSVPTLVVRRQWRHLAASGLGVAGLLALYHWGYGSAFPLSAGVKLGESGLADVGPQYLLHAGLAVAPLVLWGRRSWADWAPAALFIGFHALFTTEVMGMHGRFYAPVVPWLVMGVRHVRVDGRLLIWALAVAAFYRAGAIPGDDGWPIGRVHADVQAAFVGAVLLARWPALSAALLCWSMLRGGVPSPVFDDHKLAMRLRIKTASWQGLPTAIRCVGREAHAFHTEIGLVGMHFSTVTDFSGLTRSPGSFDEQCRARQPELIWLPHRSYAELRREAELSPCLAKGYREVTSTDAAPLYVRNDLPWPCSTK